MPKSREHSITTTSNIIIHPASSGPSLKAWINSEFTICRGPAHSLNQDPSSRNGNVRTLPKGSDLSRSELAHHLLAQWERASRETVVCSVDPLYGSPWLARHQQLIAGTQPGITPWSMGVWREAARCERPGKLSLWRRLAAVMKQGELR